VVRGLQVEQPCVMACRVDTYTVVGVWKQRGAFIFRIKKFTFDVHESVHQDIVTKTTNKMQLCRLI